MWILFGIYSAFSRYPNLQKWLIWDLVKKKLVEARLRLIFCVININAIWLETHLWLMRSIWNLLAAVTKVGFFVDGDIWCSSRLLESSLCPSSLQNIQVLRFSSKAQRYLQWGIELIFWNDYATKCDKTTCNRSKQNPISRFLLHPDRSIVIYFKFQTFLWIYRFRFRSGNFENPSDKFSNTSVLACFVSQNSARTSPSLENVFTKKKPCTEDGFTVIGKSNEPSSLRF